MPSPPERIDFRKSRSNFLRGMSRWSIQRWAIILAIAAIVARLVRFSLNFPLWGDEGFVAVNFLESSYATLVKPLLYNQIVPLGFMWATRATVDALGHSEYALRLLPFMAGALAIPLYWRFLRANLGPRTALLALGFLGGAYYAIRHSCELKAYSTDLLIGLALIMLAQRVQRQPRDAVRWIVLILAAAISVWCSYPAIFVCGGIGIFLAISIQRERLIATIGGPILFGLTTIASFIAMYVVYGAPHSAAANAGVAGIGEHIDDYWAEAFPPLNWLAPLWLLQVHAGKMMAYPNGGPFPFSAVTLLLVLSGGITLWRTKRPLLVLLVSPLIFNLAAAAIHKYPYGQTVRTMLYAAPAICTLAGLGLFVALRWGVARLIADFPGLARAIPPWKTRDAVRGAAMILTLFAIAAIGLDVAHPYKKDANARARSTIRDLGKRVHPGDRVVTFNAAPKPVPYAPFIAAWRGDGAQFLYYMNTLLPVHVECAPTPADVSTAPKSARIFVVFFHGANFIPPRDRELVENQLKSYLEPLQELRGAPAVDHTLLQSRRLPAGEEVSWQVIDVYEFAAR